MHPIRSSIRHKYNKYHVCIQINQQHTTPTGVLEWLEHGQSGRITGRVSDGTVEIQSFGFDIDWLPAANPMMAPCLLLRVPLVRPLWLGGGRLAGGGRWGGEQLVGQFYGCLDWHIGKDHGTKKGTEVLTPAAPSGSSSCCLGAALLLLLLLLLSDGTRASEERCSVTLCHALLFSCVSYSVQVLQVAHSQQQLTTRAQCLTPRST